MMSCFVVIGRPSRPRSRVYIVHVAIDFLSFRDANMPRTKRPQQLPTIHNMQFVNNQDSSIVSDVDLPSFDANSVLKEMFVSSDEENNQQPEEGEIEQDEPTCPLCRDTLQYDEVEGKGGEPWCFYRCPAIADYTKCFVACGAADVTMYLHRIKETLHSIYMPGPASFDPASMRCFCQMSLILAMSRSDKNRHRLYLTCPKRRCSFFQWADEEPKGKNYRWLSQGVANSKLKEQRYKPYDLAKPIARRPPFEARPRS